MTTREFLFTSAIIAATLALVAMIELALPLFAPPPAARRRRAANLGLTALTVVCNWGLTSAAAVAALAVAPHGSGLMASLGLPRLAQLAVSVAVLDFSFGYLAHRAMHRSRTLWRVHRVHHSDPFVDVTTTYRTHPVEVLWRFLFLIVPVWMLGIPAGAVVIYRLLSAINGTLEHANIRLWPPLDSAVSRFWVTPNMHKVHHSRDQTETDSNYGNILSVYDRLLRTFTPTARASSVIYGLDDADRTCGESLAALLSMPFTPDVSGARRRVDTSEVPV
jgi:sterol desaturase/sphingolipid hydroxylase (fatty acid hydroxylase superfamily)